MINDAEKRNKCSFWGTNTSGKRSMGGKSWNRGELYIILKTLSIKVCTH